MKYVLSLVVILLASTLTHAQGPSQAQLDAKAEAESDLTATWSCYSFMDEQRGEAESRYSQAQDQRTWAIQTGITNQQAFDDGEDYMTSGNTNWNSGESQNSLGQVKHNKAISDFNTGNNLWNQGQWAQAVAAWADIDADCGFANTSYDAGREKYQIAKAEYLDAVESYYNSTQ